MYNVFPCETPYAFCSYGPVIEVLRTGGPGCSPVSRVAGMVDVALGGIPWKLRSSRWHAIRIRPARQSRTVLMTSNSPRRRAVAPLPSRKGEHIQHPAFGRCLGKIFHGVDEPERGARVSDIQAAGHNGPGPAAHPGEHGHVFLAVRSPVHNRLADDPRANLELPDLGAVSGVERLEPAIHRPVEHDISGSHHRSAPDRELFFHFPDSPALHRIPGCDFAAVTARSGLHLYDRRYVRRARDVIRLDAFFVLAEVLVRYVQQPGAG